MTLRTTAPFRADHVGSLLRPASLLDARERHDTGVISAEELRAIEDDCIREIAGFQENIGLSGITDGEFRRFLFHTDFLKQLQGVEEHGGLSTKFHKADGDIDFAPPRLTVSGKLAHSHPIQVADFEFLNSVTSGTAKVSIPSPTMLHFRGGREAVDSQTYPRMEDFFDDLAAAYRAEIKALAAAGCRYLQLDDTNLAYLCDPEMREGARQRGDDPDGLPRLYARIINDALRDRPDDMTVAIHLCRGNFRSAWVAEGGYEPVADVLFNQIDVDAFFLEYDDERSGDFAPLRLVPDDKFVVLGLVSTKSARLETTDELKQRIEEASRYLELDRLCLSPQCGFASVVFGNDIAQDTQRRKLDLVVQTATDVWSE